MQPVVAAREKMSQFVREQDSEQGSSEGKSCQESGRILVEERERAQQFVYRYGLIVRICHGKLRTRNEASAQRKNEKHNRKN